jgi:hypothetical protein
MNIVEQLTELVLQQPFHPFTVHVAGDRKHRIEHPDFIGFSPRKKTVVVWTQTDTAIFVNPNLISEVEEHQRKKNGRGKR